MSRKITFESIIKFREYDLLLKLDTSSIKVEFHNFMLYRAENISVFVEVCNFKV